MNNLKFKNKSQTKIAILPTSSSVPNFFITRSNYNIKNSWGNEIGITTVGTNGEPSYYGTYDQSGNVWEWTEKGIIRGGSFSSNNNFISKNSRIDLNRSNKLYKGHLDIGFRIVCIDSEDSDEFAKVEDINNFPDDNQYGNVNYNYKIKKYTITNCDYLEFLISIAEDDTNNVYNENMENSPLGGIVRRGENGEYIYCVKENMQDKPVVFVGLFSAIRYINWLSNGKPVGFQNESTTENGSYKISPLINIFLSSISGDNIYSISGDRIGLIQKQEKISLLTRNTINPNTNNFTLYYMPTENEWYKAAFYDKNKFGNNLSGYWKYATKSDNIPIPTNINETGDGPFDTDYYCSLSNIWYMYPYQCLSSMRDSNSLVP